MKATVERGLCTGCGVCEIICPEVFRMNGGMNRGGRRVCAVATSEMVPEVAENFCVDARDCCIPKAIEVSD